MQGTTPDEANYIRKRDFYNRIEKIFAVILILGLCIEIWVAWEPANDWWKFLITVGGSALVTIGVAGEVYFSGRSGKYAETLRSLSEIKVAEANARAAEANRKSAEATLETERLRAAVAGRSITTEQRRAIITALNSHPMNIFVEIAGPDTETFKFAEDLIDVLKDAGATVDWKPELYADSLTGLIVRESGDGRSALLLVTFQNVGILATAGEAPLNNYPNNVVLRVAGKPVPT